MNGTSDVGHYVVKVQQTPMFRYGPAQSFGADFNLTKGQHVVMLRREFGYSRVMTDEGQTGYVATEDLASAPPPPKPASTPKINSRPSLFGPRIRPTGTSRPGVSSANNRAILQGAPLFEGGELPPLPENTATPPPRPSEPPKFRYPKPKPGFRIAPPKPAEG
jgi:hypothetical protein